MQKSWLWAVLIPVLFVAAWWIGYNYYNPDQNPDLNSHENTQIERLPVTVAPTDERGERLAENADSAPQESSEKEAVIEEVKVKPLQYNGMTIDEQSRDARTCFNFRQPLNDAQQQDPRDYISISPKLKFAHSINGNDLCLTGFDFSTDYRVTIRAGFNGLADRKLAADITETISFGDKPKYVGFVGNGIILPRIGAQGVAVDTVNVDTLNVEVSRVTDRMIARRNPQIGESVLEGDYGWEGRDAASEIRSVIWDGQVDVENLRNQTVRTIIPVSELVGALQPGAYIIRVSRKHTDSEREYARAWRWVFVADLAITSYKGSDGLNVAVRSIDTARPVKGVKVLLVADNNESLGDATTDAMGHAKFPAALMRGTGNLQPRMVLAYGEDQEFAMLDLRRAPLDMSDHNVDGRTSGDLFDIYGFSERGVYRPGETVHFTAMLRDPGGRSLADQDVNLTVRRPNGMEAFTHRVSAKDLEQTHGVINWNYEVPNSAPRGKWNLQVKPDGIKDSTVIDFSVADFVPQKLKISVKAVEAPITIGEIRDINVDAQFLYGAPGTALSSEAEARIRIDHQPFKDYADYSFGPTTETFREQIIDLGGGVTDGAGLVTFGLDYKNDPVKSVFPMRAEIVAGVAEPGGRYIQESLKIPVRTEPVYVGLASEYSGDRIPRGKPAAFKVVAVDGTGKAVAKKLTWKLVEEDWDYHWYRERGRWRYQYDIRDIPLETGEISISANAPAIWTKNTERGRRRIEFYDGDKLLASKQFWRGWGRTEGRSTAPDSLELNALNEKVKAGDTVKMTVNAPYAGEGELVIASNKVHAIQTLRLKEGVSDLSFKFDPSWGDSVYAMVTLYTPRDESDRPVPHRAVGVSYIELDRSAQKLELSIDQPKVIRPRKTHEFVVNVLGDGRQEDVMMTFAAVDEGILQITKYKSPDAAAHYFGKKALGLELRDDYGRILNPNLGTPATMRQGGDGIGGEGLTVVPTKTVAFFEGPVKIRNGTARIKLDIPDFNGELRVMATAWNAEAVGSTSAPVKVRDQVPSIVALPRFLAPGDETFATISLDNVEGRDGQYTAKLDADGVIKAKDTLTFDLDQGQRKQDRIPILASTTGIDDITLNVAGPNGYAVKSNYPVQIRSPYYPITRQKWVELGKGESLELTTDWIENFVPEGTDVTVSFTRLPGLDPAPIVSSLRKYPYGCTEQTVSTALPLIYASNLGGIPGQTDTARRREVQKAVHKVSNRMSVDGSIGLWRAGDETAVSWVGIYASDFLFRAAEEGYYVSGDVLNRAKSALSELSRSPRYTRLGYAGLNDRSDYWQRRLSDDAAYALYVMARMGEGDLGQARYHYDNHRSKMRTPLAVAYLGGALKMLGDDRRGDAAFDLAVQKLKHKDSQNYYYSELRDLAGIVAVAAESGAGERVAEYLDDLGIMVQQDQYLNTQEKGYLVLALKSLLGTMDPVKVTAKNVSLTKSKTMPKANLYGTDLVRQPIFSNKGSQTIWASVSIDGPPVNPPKSKSDGFNLKKQIFTLDGKPIGDRAIKQGERLMVKLAYNSTEYFDRSAVIADLLPAGFEIETILKPGDGNRRDGLEKGPYEWVGRISKLEVAEARDDRLVVSMSTYKRDDYVTAYIIRAVTPGKYVLPGAVVEDMYRPEDNALTEAGRIEITANPSL